MCCAHLSVSLQVLVPPRGFATFVTFILSQEGRGSNTVGVLRPHRWAGTIMWHYTAQICKRSCFVFSGDSVSIPEITTDITQLLTIYILTGFVCEIKFQINTLHWSD